MSAPISHSILKFSVFLQKYRTPIILTSCSGVFAAKLFSHVFPDISYRKLYQSCHRGEPDILSEKLESVFQQVLKDYGLRSPKNFSAFASYGFHPVGAGVPWLPAGAQIGIPANFNSTSDDPSGISNRTVLINGKEVDWSSEAGSTLQESLVLSLDAQKFAIAREVARLQSGGPILTAAVAPFCLGGVWIYSIMLKQIFGLHTGHMLLRGLMNVIAIGLCSVFYVLTTDAVTQALDYNSDHRAAGLSHDYAKGGVEFYNKILSRNQMLRSLMGEKGESMYAPNGNLFPANLLQMKYTPYTSRRDGIQNLLKNEKV